MKTAPKFIKVPQPPQNTAGATWSPNTDVYEVAGGLVIKVEISGMKKEELELSIEENRVRISGHRPDGCRSPGCRFLVMEISYGHFESVIELPPGYALPLATASYQNGFLRIDVPHASAEIR